LQFRDAFALNIHNGSYDEVLLGWRCNNHIVRERQSLVKLTRGDRIPSAGRSL
jgi:hypothetical protein